MTAPRPRRKTKASPAAPLPPGVALATGATARQTRTLADVEQLMVQMREANGRLIVAAVHAQDLSDEAHTETAQARDAVERLLNQLRCANEQLATATEEARQGEERYRHLSGRLLTLQDEERRRLARDLHDSTGQCLAALTMNLDVVERAARGLNARSRRALADSRALATQCAREVRTLAYLLHPPMLDEMGLLSSVRWYAAGFAKRSGIHVALELGQIGRLPAAIETALFRVVQEALTNIHRHASTTTASIRLSATADAVALDIHDEGHGLGTAVAQDSEARPESLGIGIQGMRERVRQLNGTFDVEFTDTGTTVRVRVPTDRATP